jgi:hypothetical protein
MTPSIALHMIDNEPRINDLELAKRLGYARGVRIRDIIRRNSNELTRYGLLATVEKAPETEGGRSTEEYFLNEGQAIRVATLVDMVSTGDVCEMVLKAYVEHRRSQTAVQGQTPDLKSLVAILQQMAETLAFLTKHMVPR